MKKTKKISSLDLEPLKRDFQRFPFSILGILSIIAGISLGIFQNSNAYTWAIQNIMTTGNQDGWMSLAYDGSGNPGIANWRQDTGSLETAIWNGSSWDIETVDTTGLNTGKHASILWGNMGGVNRWMVSYSAENAGQTDRRLGFAYRVGSGSGSGCTDTDWSCEIVDDPTTNITYTSLGLTGTTPAIGYHTNDDDVFYAERSQTLFTAQTNPTANNLYAVKFIDANTGWAVGDSGTILKTTNGGASWGAQTSGTVLSLKSISFIDANTGWAVGNNGTENAIILKTTDGGANWTTQRTTSYQIHGIGFADGNNGWIVGNSLFSFGWTSDGGANWNFGAGGMGTFRNISVVNSTNAWAVGEDGAIRKLTSSVNGSSSAQVSGTANHLRGTDFIDVNNGWTVGDSGTILKTTDGGTNWSAQTSNTTNHLRGTDFIDASNGYAVGDGGTVLRTNNGGTNWTAITSGTTSNLQGINYLNLDTNWTIGQTSILKSANAGTTCVNGNSNWRCETIDSTGNAGRGVILKTTSGGTPALAYRDVTNSTIKYAIRNSGAGCVDSDWTCETIIGSVQNSPDGNCLTECSRLGFTFDSSDTAGIVYTDTTSGNPLNLATRTAGSGCSSANWTCEQVAKKGGKYFSLIYNSTTPYIGFYENGTLRLAVKVSGKWRTEILDGCSFGCNDTVNSGSHTAIGRTGNTLGIAFREDDNKDTEYLSADIGTLPALQSFTISAVEVTGSNVGASIDIAYDSTGNPGIAYKDTTANALKYAKYNGTSWSLETVETTAGDGVSLTFDGSDIPHISFDNNDAFVAYAKKVAGTGCSNADWTCENVNNRETTSSRIRIINNIPVILQYPAGSWAEIVAMRDGGNTGCLNQPDSDWTCETIGANGSRGVALEANPGNQITAVYHYSNGMYYLTRVGGGAGAGCQAGTDSDWSCETITNNSSTSSSAAQKIGFAYNGSTPGIIYQTGSSGGEIIYATRTGGGSGNCPGGVQWNCTSMHKQYTTAGDIKLFGLAYDGTTPRITFVDPSDDDIVYATTNGKWYTEAINGCATGCANNISITEMGTSLRNGKLGVAYYNAAATDLYFAQTTFNTAPNAPTTPQADGSGSPLTTDNTNPTFSWTFSDPDAGNTQSAYQILVASSETNLNANTGDVCDSGKKTGSSASVNAVTTCGSALSAGTRYWKIRAWDNSDAAGSYTANQTLTMSATPTAPSACTTSSITESGITIGWTDNSSTETGFEVERSTDGVTFTNITTAATNTISYAASSLTPNTQYTLRVRAAGSGGQSSYATCAAAYTLANVPAAPTVTTTSGTSLNVVINENSNPAATEFSIQIGAQYVQANGTVGAGQVWQTKTNWGATGKAITGLSINTAYGAGIIARNGGGTATNASSSTTKYTQVATPTHTTNNIALGDNNTAQMDITIGESGNPANVQYSIKIGTQYVQANGTMGATQIYQTATNWGSPKLITGLSPGTTYTVQVIAKNGDNDTTNGSSTETTINTPAVAPSNGRLSSNTASSITITWNTNNNGSNTQYFITSSSGNSGSWISTNTWTEEGLRAGTTYTYAIKAKNGAGIETAETSFQTGTQAAEASSGGGGGTILIVTPPATPKSAIDAKTRTPTSPTSTKTPDEKSTESAERTEEKKLIERPQIKTIEKQIEKNDRKTIIETLTGITAEERKSDAPIIKIELKNQDGKKINFPVFIRTLFPIITEEDSRKFDASLTTYIHGRIEPEHTRIGFIGKIRNPKKYLEETRKIIEKIEDPQYNMPANLFAVDPGKAGAAGFQNEERSGIKIKTLKFPEIRGTFYYGITENGNIIFATSSTGLDEGIKLIQEQIELKQDIPASEKESSPTKMPACEEILPNIEYLKTKGKILSLKESGIKITVNPEGDDEIGYYWNICADAKKYQLRLSGKNFENTNGLLIWEGLRENGNIPEMRMAEIIRQELQKDDGIVSLRVVTETKEKNIIGETITINMEIKKKEQVDALIKIKEEKTPDIAAETEKIAEETAEEMKKEMEEETKTEEPAKEITKETTEELKEKTKTEETAKETTEELKKEEETEPEEEPPKKIIALQIGKVVILEKKAQKIAESDEEGGGDGGEKKGGGGGSGSGGGTGSIGKNDGRGREKENGSGRSVKIIDGVKRGEFLAAVVNNLELRTVHKTLLTRIAKKKAIKNYEDVEKNEKNYPAIRVAGAIGLTNIIAPENRLEPQNFIKKADALRVMLTALEEIKPQTCEEIISEVGSFKKLQASETPFNDVAPGKTTKCWHPKVINRACEIGLIECRRGTDLETNFEPESFLTKKAFELLMKKSREYAAKIGLKEKFEKDTDGDGIIDLLEQAVYNTNPNNKDSDGDELSDGEEILKHVTSPKKKDSDNDRLSDGDEILKHKTNPLKKDTDGDGSDDAREIREKTDPLDPESFPHDDDGNKVDDAWEKKYSIIIEDGIKDSDNDGISDRVEYEMGSNPKKSDSDNDGISDGQEILDFGTDPTEFNAPTEIEIQIQITSPTPDQISATASPLFKGTAKAGSRVQIAVRNDFGIEEIVGETNASENNLFATDIKALQNGTYLFIAKEIDPITQKVLLSEPVHIAIDTTKAVETPSISYLGNAIISEERLEKGRKTREEILIDTLTPVLRGKTEFGSQVVAVWRSAISSSSLIADSASGEFEIKPPTRLSPGPHEVIIYSVKPTNNAVSQILKIKFRVVEGALSDETGLIAYQKDKKGAITGLTRQKTILPLFYDILAILIGGAIITALISAYRKKKKEEAASNNQN